MDVDFLSRMIGELILDHNSLSLPGLGTFVAEDMPATFSDRGYTINPPYRRLAFWERKTSDGLLSELYAADNGIAIEEATAIIESFLEDLKAKLEAEKTVDLPGLGRLRATRENTFFFVPDEDLDISPDAFGLEPVSLKSHVLTSLPEVPVRQEPAPAPEPVPTPEPAPTHDQAPAPEPRPRKRRRGFGWAIGTVAAAAALLLAFVLVSRLAPGSTDRLLYTQEELAIINHPEDGSGLPR